MVDAKPPELTLGALPIPIPGIAEILLGQKQGLNRVVVQSLGDPGAVSSRILEQLSNELAERGAKPGVLCRLRLQSSGHQDESDTAQ